MRMNAEPLWTFPLTAVACAGASLLAVGLLSRLTGFSFNPSVVILLSIVSFVAASTIRRS